MLFWRIFFYLVWSPNMDKIDNIYLFLLLNCSLLKEKIFFRMIYSIHFLIFLFLGFQLFNSNFQDQFLKRSIHIGTDNYIRLEWFLTISLIIPLSPFEACIFWGLLSVGDPHPFSLSFFLLKIIKTLTTDF